MRCTAFVLVSLLLCTAHSTKWLVQNLYRSANNCDPQALAAASSWATGTCLKWNSTHYSVKGCDSQHVTTWYCTDAACSLCLQGEMYPVNQCGSITTAAGGQGIFFGCFEASQPPTLPNITDNVLNQFTYSSSNCSPGPSSNSSVIQVLSYYSGWCLANERRYCGLDNGALYAKFQTPCIGGVNASVSLNTCTDAEVNGNDLHVKNVCEVAVNPTPAPVDPNAPIPPFDESTLTACENAKTYEQCILGAPTSDNGKVTLPATGLANRCCVWCATTNSSSSTAGGCRTPSFNKNLCTCNAPGSANFTDLVKGYGCPVPGTYAVDCKCTGKPLGAPYCVEASALSVFAALAIFFAASIFF